MKQEKRRIYQIAESEESKLEFITSSYKDAIKIYTPEFKLHYKRVWNNVFHTMVCRFHDLIDGIWEILSLLFRLPFFIIWSTILIIFKVISAILLIPYFRCIYNISRYKYKLNNQYKKMLKKQDDK